MISSLITVFSFTQGLVTEAKPPVQWNKGHAAIYILRGAFGVDWSDRSVDNTVHISAFGLDWLHR
jgi:hypothetical protein